MKGKYGVSQIPEHEIEDEKQRNALSFRYSIRKLFNDHEQSKMAW